MSRKYHPTSFNCLSEDKAAITDKNSEQKVNERLFPKLENKLKTRNMIKIMGNRKEQARTKNNNIN